MSKNSRTYWYCQFLGWSFYILINLVFFGLKNHSSFRDYLIYIISLPVAILLTHGYRKLIRRYNIMELKIPLQSVIIILSSGVMGAVFFLCTAGLLSFSDVRNLHLSYIKISESVINDTVPFFLWNIIYFGFKYFQNYRKAEITSLRYLAASRESELNNLKAQLNPHFMFNSLNSIRALVDEDPAKAKDAITLLSGILRNTLLLNANKLIPLSEEIDLVKDYLNLEKIRYEERLNYSFNIEKDAAQCLIPPFIVQTQVENAIKHGISRLPGEGKIIVEAFKTGNSLKITVSNTGKLNHDKPLTGVGFSNSVHRLELLYGTEGKISINEQDNLVVVDINIPLK